MVSLQFASASSQVIRRRRPQTSTYAAASCLHVSVEYCRVSSTVHRRSFSVEPGVGVSFSPLRRDVCALVYIFTEHCGTSKLT
jgi:hypothetical protein